MMKIQIRLVVDELAALVVPAVQLTDLCADFLFYVDSVLRRPSGSLQSYEKACF